MSYFPTSTMKSVGVVLGSRNKIVETLKFGKSRVFPEESLNMKILDPGGEIVLMWNRIFIFFCLLALFIDPLYFYLPIMDKKAEFLCVSTDSNMRTVVTCFRSFADIFYLLHMLVKFRTAFVAPSSRVFGRGELVRDPDKIFWRYIKTDFCIDLIATLPLPQVLIWVIIPSTRTSRTDHKNNILALIVLLQYIPRLYLIFPLSSQIIKATGVVTKTAWAGAAYNLMQYLLASHVLGASWYLLSHDRYMSCLKMNCKNELGPRRCDLSYLDCESFTNTDRMKWANNTKVFKNCDPSNTISFQYGIFENALTKNIFIENIFPKYLYCLWWGLQQLSSYGQNLSTSTYIEETAFAILISILGLVIFALLIGNMQTYLQSMTVRLEEWRVKRRDTEEWMEHRQLPEDLRERVQGFVQYKWLATRGVDEETILQGLPADLRRDIQRHLCLDLVRRVPLFSQMDDQLLDAICERLVSSLYTKGTYIVREEDPVTEILFIIRGRLESSTTNGGRTGFFNSTTLRPGEFCGEELLGWALVPKSGTNLPCSTRTVRALVEVEAFALRADDLRFVANQFRRLHSKKLQHSFRFYSHHWRTWAACFIQAAWRRQKKRAMAVVLAAMEENDDDDRHSSPHANLSAVVYASRFAANTRRVIKVPVVVDDHLPKLPLPKPDEPDFSMLPEDD